jgi:hypothetical protein
VGKLKRGREGVAELLSAQELEQLLMALRKFASGSTGNAERQLARRRIARSNDCSGSGAGAR